MTLPRLNTNTQERSAPRTNTMLAAKLEFGGVSSDAFVRNVSVTGALIEGRHLPSAGSELCLIRAGERINGIVVWAENGRCGVNFDEPIDLAAMIRKRASVAATTDHQARVDFIQQAVREKLVPDAVIKKPTRRLEDDLGYAQRLIEAATEVLSSDAYLLGRYGQALQQLDEAEQVMRRLDSAVRELSGTTGS